MIYEKETEKLNIIELALWDSKDKLELTENVAAPYSSGINPPLNRNKSENCFIVDTISIDEFVQENCTPKIDFIKMDIEGAEMPALKGALKTIKKYRPQLAISIYHSDGDFINIPLFLKKALSDYVFRIGHYSYNQWETVLYALPKEMAEHF